MYSIIGITRRNSRITPNSTSSLMSSIIPSTSSIFSFFQTLLTAWLKLFHLVLGP
ncbi:hypothetical protein K469DRAFT_391794 [Zopfia rhizophila CBS 207.26]|uniref:Uncharacterized protein n=1 Tax=Zopfia rhizophila CBS 207.26 TaxID=1314779 RepID=A0A6A6EJ36_9PEZI|nr:hypothetical protein K469DRAFT_391794 [Zopfia rhizophila CBS 207.26]